MILVFGMLILSFVSAQLNSSGLEGAIDNFEKAKAGIDNLENNKWDYISQQWRELLLKNSFISAVDSVLKKIGAVFVFLFSEDYVLSFSFFVIAALWIFFFYQISNIIVAFSAFGKWVSLIIGFAITVIIAHVGGFRLITNTAFKIMFYKTGIWPWIFFIGYLALLVVVVILARVARAAGAAKKKAAKEQKEKTDKEILHIQAESLKNMYEDEI